MCHWRGTGQRIGHLHTQCKRGSTTVCSSMDVASTICFTSSLLPPLLLYRVPSILLRMTLFSDALTMATSMASQVNLRQPGQTECGGHTVVPDPTQPLSIARRPQPRGRTSCGVTSTTLRPGAMLWLEFRAFTSTGEGSCVRSLVPRLGTDLGLKQAGMGRG